MGLVCSSSSNQDDPTFNTCVCDNSKYSLAAYADYLVGKEQCSNGQPQKIEIIGGINPNGGEANSCYQWVNKPVDLCTGDLICVV